MIVFHRPTDSEFSRNVCVCGLIELNHTQITQEAESYTHGQVHTCSTTRLREYRTHTSREQDTHPLEKMLKRQRAIHMDRYIHVYTHMLNHTHTSKEQHASVIQAQSHTHLKTLLKR